MKKIMLIICAMFCVSSLSNAWPNWSWLQSVRRAPAVSSVISKVRSLKMDSLVRGCQRTLVRYKKPIAFVAVASALAGVCYAGSYYPWANTVVSFVAQPVFSYFEPWFSNKDAQEELDSENSNQVQSVQQVPAESD